MVNLRKNAHYFNFNVVMPIITDNAKVNVFIKLQKPSNITTPYRCTIRRDRKHEKIFGVVYKKKKNQSGKERILCWVKI